jgi:hypothetical protein
VSAIGDGSRPTPGEYRTTADGCRKSEKIRQPRSARSPDTAYREIAVTSVRTADWEKAPFWLPRTANLTIKTVQFKKERRSDSHRLGLLIGLRSAAVAHYQCTADAFTSFVGASSEITDLPRSLLGRSVDKACTTTW